MCLAVRASVNTVCGRVLAPRKGDPNSMHIFVLIYDALIVVLAALLIRDELLSVFADDLTVVLTYFMRMIPS